MWNSRLATPQDTSLLSLCQLINFSPFHIQKIYPLSRLFMRIQKRHSITTTGKIKRPDSWCNIPVCLQVLLKASISSLRLWKPNTCVSSGHLYWYWKIVSDFNAVHILEMSLINLNTAGLYSSSVFKATFYLVMNLLEHLRKHFGPWGHFTPPSP